MINSLYEIVNQVRNPETMTFGTFMVINGILGLTTLVGYGLYHSIKEGNNDISGILRDYDGYNHKTDDLAKRMAEILKNIK